MTFDNKLATPFLLMFSAFYQLVWFEAIKMTCVGLKQKMFSLKFWTQIYLTHPTFIMIGTSPKSLSTDGCFNPLTSHPMRILHIPL